MTEPYEGELLPAIRAPSDPSPRHAEPTATLEPHETVYRHALCHREVRQTFPPWVAFCGDTIHWLALTRRQDLPKCPICLAASVDHAQVCDCWQLFPQARLPR